MQPAEAARVLGVPAGSDAHTVRAAWRRHIGDHHPDRAGATGTAAAARINQAYTVLRDAAPRGPSDPSATAPVTRPPVHRHTPGAMLLNRDTVALDAPATGVIDLLAEVAHRIGDISHLDRDEGLLELIATPESGPPCSVVVTVESQAGTDSTSSRPRNDPDGCCGDPDLEVYLSVESLDAREAPPVDAVVSRFLDEISRSV